MTAEIELKRLDPRLGTEFPLPEYATALSAGRGHHCAVLTDASVRCWGDNNDGQLGNGSQTDSASPVGVSGIGNAVAVVAGDRHSCALLADGSVRCWGYRGFSSGFGTVRSGLMGDGGTGVTPALVPVTVSGIGTAVALATGPSHTCALLQDDSVSCWGSSNTTVEQLVPTPVAGLSGASISAALRVAAAGFPSRPHGRQISTAAITHNMLPRLIAERCSRRISSRRRSARCVR